MNDNKTTVQDLTFTLAEVNALRSALAAGTVLAETAKENAEYPPSVELYGGWKDELDAAIALVARESDRLGNLRFDVEGGGI
jgi:hypothetical protein